MKNSIICTRLISLRKENHKSQQDIATYLHVSHTAVCNYECGRNKLPLEHLIKLTELYHVSADYVLGISDIKTNDYPSEISFLTAQNSKLQKENEILVFKMHSFKKNISELLSKA